MPMYEYRCEECSTRFERYSPTPDDDKRTIVCPNCGSNGVEKVLSSFKALESKGVAGSCGSFGGYS